MCAKTLVIAELGERELLYPALVNRGLAANDRAKYYLSLLQAALDHADQPDSPAPTLRRERVAAGVGDSTLDGFTAEAVLVSPGRYRAPRWSEVEGVAVAALREMLAAAEPDAGAQGSEYTGRLSAILAALGPAGEEVARERLARLASGIRSDGDSLHLLVLDLHARLNALQSQLATESVDGASAYGLDDASRRLVAAFMRGLNRTEPLRFDHPGLGTTATLHEGRLVIQNDIGTTDAHVLVLHVEGLTATVTYSDVHAERLSFFQRQLAPFAVEWPETVTRTSAIAGEEGRYHLTAGRFVAQDDAQLAAYLEHLGSRLVYLIDWNRARKQLRSFCGNRRAIALLEWAARQDVGHMAFLKLGGDRLLYDVVETVRLPLRPGDRLDQILGREATEEFLQAALRLASEGLRHDRSEFLLRDALRAELARHVATAEVSALSLLRDQATLIVELAAGLRDAVAHARIDDRGFVARHADRARAWEHQADQLVNQARQLAQRWPEAATIQELLARADDAADCLEEAAFLLALPREAGPDEALLMPVGQLAEAVARGAEAHTRAVATAMLLPHGGREDYADFLEAVDRVLTAEHQADAAHRAARSAILTRATDFGQALRLNEVAQLVESAADALMHAALRLRRYVLERLRVA
jgi:uncharacterized protein Yka (UPF0111/DUF47 family)